MPTCPGDACATMGGDTNARRGNVLVEARYTPGPGVLIGSGVHWVLVSDPGDERLLDRIWELVSTPQPLGTSVLDGVVALVDPEADHSRGGPSAALAAVDLTPGAVEECLRWVTPIQAFDMLRQWKQKYGR